MTIKVRSGQGRPTPASNQIKELLENTLYPGTILHGVWFQPNSSVRGTLFLYDVSFLGIPRKEYQVHTPDTVQALKQTVSQNSEDLFRLKVDELESDEEFEHMIYSGELLPINFYDLSPRLMFSPETTPQESGLQSTLDFPQDDWTMEMRIRGIDVQIHESSDPDHQAQDYTEVAHDFRREVIEGIVNDINRFPQVSTVARVKTGFPHKYREWEREAKSISSGVMMKKRRSQFPVGYNTESGTYFQIISDEWAQIYY